MLWLRIAGLLGFLGVALGAFGAHALRARLTPEMLEVWKTAVLYHLLHAAALLALALYAKSSSSSSSSGTDIRWGGLFFTTGIILFSGSLYALSLSGIKPLGAITPLGGVAFLLGWGWIALKLAAR